MFSVPPQEYCPLSAAGTGCYTSTVNSQSCGIFLYSTKQELLKVVWVLALTSPQTIKEYLIFLLDILM